ncbi:bifunctional folylpolyglutamate synthase/dihydrofolate synthase [Methylobacterium sp. Leaf469]|jgi:dihydrofolate synthase/folylpolyglutamate synthase|uniref:bifunctional folylpolyglutamate synthase/dihydrofolate synthase n=1 Tax=unclassified Methylobacterium TaxID=2615210 RepID=UPI000701AFE4|nr:MULTISPECIES: folylpolyglutamate synthase/dihydrofolate synthase family protein [unclassified Methylobacterium]KQO68731.1 bifunctional folylpolyglutamate synthase/dihydrofolate synthase [Methylobacterium sp. Leaf87]KQP29457.1 bifunctional folylpolyglutamate synthase/dihydrofolate synthase [Methylobacterium sp. Leaf102]KQU01009.1 bifunctional folylpolyglutamate synthase/dihydrofolate synthase [Methylobacterium sp. Leaf469]USU33100.1 bifunctional folylpolyglutamate synthase/dihydrofolate synth
MDSSDALMARFLALHPRTIDLSLGRIQRLLERLGHPERKLPPVIHVAGTNGKGSTIAFMRAILEAGGLAAHVYTSPHLVRFHERIRIGAVGGGQYVPEDQLADALARCEAANAGEPITVFEITTAAAFLLFSETPADVLLLEVGLGGRVDATNVIDRVACAVVTPIGRDHAEYLGDTVEAVATEKAGIFKSGCPAVIAAQDYVEADSVLCRLADAVGADPIRVGNQDFSVHAERGRLVFQDEVDLFDLPRPRLNGRHQLTNAGTAIAALRAAGFGDIGIAAIERGLDTVDWPGRLQRLNRGRLSELVPEGAELWLDGGHNVDGGRILAAAMADLGERSDVPLVLVVGLLGTKDAEGFLRNFVGLARTLIAVPIAGQMAARPADEVAQIAVEVGLDAHVASGIEAALESLCATAFERPPRILICGSLYLAGAVLTANGTPPV